MASILIMLATSFLSIHSTLCYEQMLHQLSTDHDMIWKSISAPGMTKDGWHRLPRNSSAVVGYQVCDIRAGISKVNNWLVSDYIPKEGAKVIHIELKLSIVSCAQMSLQPGGGGVRESCVEKLGLHVHQTASERTDIQYVQRPDELGQRYFSEPVDVSPDPLSTPESDIYKSVFVTKELRSSSRGLYIAISDGGACAKIQDIKVYTYVCARLEDDYAIYPKTFSTMDPFVGIKGVCKETAEAELSVSSRRCSSTGTWLDSTSNSGCVCKPGYFPVRPGECRECNKGMFKSVRGNVDCGLCPDYSQALSQGQRVCQCKPGYKRDNPENHHDSCAKPPSKPRNLTSEVIFNKVILYWQAPLDMGGRDHIWYRISCQTGSQECYSMDNPYDYGGIKFSVGPYLIYDHKVEIRDLRPHTKYTFVVHADNSVVSSFSEAEIGFSNAEDITIQTDVPMTVRNLHVAHDSPTSIRLKWSPLEKKDGTGGGSGFKYLVKMNIDGRELGIMSETEVPEKVFSNLDSGYYGFSVGFKTEDGLDGPFTKPQYLHLLGDESELGLLLGNSPPRMVVMMGIVATVLLTLMTIFASAVCLLRRRHHTTLTSQVNHGSRQTGLWEKCGPVAVNGTLLSDYSGSTQPQNSPSYNSGVRR